MANFGFRTRVAGMLQYDSRFTGLGRIIATIETGTGDGSYQNAQLATGQVDWQVNPATNGMAQLPQISVAGDTLSWVFPAQAAGYPRFTCFITIWVV